MSVQLSCARSDTAATQTNPQYQPSPDHNKKTAHYLVVSLFIISKSPYTLQSLFQDALGHTFSSVFNFKCLLLVLNKKICNFEQRFIGHIKSRFLIVIVMTNHWKCCNNNTQAIFHDVLSCLFTHAWCADDDHRSLYTLHLKYVKKTVIHILTP